MSESAQVARPYAKAVFEIASAAGTVQRWSSLLNALAAITRDKQMMAAVKNPHFTAEKLQQIIQDTLKAMSFSELSEEEQRFITLLLSRHRIELLPLIATFFDELMSAAESTIEMMVSSAHPLNDGQKKALEKALAQRFGRRPALNFEVREALIGGILVQAGDQVIDASVSGQLTRMMNSVCGA